jgi:hypothetical protein
MRKQRQRTSPPPKSAKADDPMVSDAQQFWYLHPNACTQEKKPPPPRRPAFPCFEETHGCQIGGRCTPVTVAFFRGILLVLYIFFCLPSVSVRLYDEATAREEEVEVEGHSSDPGFCVGWKQRGGRPHFCWWIYSGSNPDPLGLVRLALNPCGLSGIGWV